MQKDCRAKDIPLSWVQSVQWSRYQASGFPKCVKVSDVMNRKLRQILGYLAYEQGGLLTQPQ